MKILTKNLFLVIISIVLSINLIAQSTSSKKLIIGESAPEISIQNHDLQLPTSTNLRNWNLQFNHPLVAEFTGQAGIETDGSFFYVTQWNNDSVYKYDMTGTYVSAILISGVSNLRDLAYDGTYFYGSNTSATIYEMDFTNETLISTISAPTGTEIRHISYDSDNNGFWVGNWATDLDLISRTGLLINSISAADHGLSSTYGTAYDNITPGGPYLWAINATSVTDAASIYLVNIATGQQMGVEHDVIPDLGLTDGLGGGLFIHPDIITGTVTLGGLVQSQAIFGYELSSLMNPWDGSIPQIISPVSGVGLTNAETVSIEINNYGSNAITNFNVSFQVNGGSTVTEICTSTVLTGESFIYSFAMQVDLSAISVYEISASIEITNDAVSSNNEASKKVYSLSNMSEKLVLVEHFTQASCAPCASQNPALDALITNTQNIDKVVHIAYHTSWPGNDPMFDFNDNNGDGDARTDYYSVSGVPNCVIAGNIAQGSPGIVNQDRIDAEYGRPGIFNITGSAIATVPDNILQIDLAFESYCNFPAGIIKAHVVLVEDVEYTSAPGTNGEKDFPDVMRKIFPSENGTTLNNTSDGEVDSVHITYDIQSPIDPYKTKLIVFVQHDQSKEVYMATSIPVAVYNGINDVVNNEIRIYPNPTTGVINLTNIENSRVTVFNALGGIVSIAENVNEQTSIDLSKCPNGNYFVKIVSKNNVVTMPINLTR